MPLAQRLPGRLCRPGRGWVIESPYRVLDAGRGRADITLIVARPPRGRSWRTLTVWPPGRGALGSARRRSSLKPALHQEGLDLQARPGVQLSRSSARRSTAAPVSSGSALSRRASRGAGTCIRPGARRGWAEPGGGGLGCSWGLLDREGLVGLSMRRVGGEAWVFDAWRLTGTVGERRRLAFCRSWWMWGASGSSPLPAQRRRSSFGRAGIEMAAPQQWAAYRARSLARERGHHGDVCRRCADLLPHTDARNCVPLPGFGVDPTTSMYAADHRLRLTSEGVALNLEPEAQAEQDTGMTADEWARQAGGSAGHDGRRAGPGRVPALTEPGSSSTTTWTSCSTSGWESCSTGWP